MDFPANGAFPLSRPYLSTISPNCLASVAAVVQSNAVSSFAWPTANLAYFVAVILNDTTTVQRMAVQNGATVAGNLDVGIYDIRGKLLVSSGTTAQAGASAPQVITIASTTLTPNVYMLAMSTNSTTATYMRLFGSATSFRTSGVAQMATAFPLPPTATFAAMAGNNIPLIAASSKTVF